MPHRTKAARRAYFRKWASANREKLRANWQRWVNKPGNRARANARSLSYYVPSRHRENEQQRNERLTNGAVRKLLTAHGAKLPASAVPSALVELKRAHIQLLRSIRETQASD